uniref:JmjC domain-containing protein n=1 Tax=Triticum urartu TaxID=4572 RepID=A0A8R7TXP3_TRIUA
MQAEEDAEFVGARVEAGLRAARFSAPPSSEEFAASIEPKNVPAVFRGVLKGSAASPRWDPLHGGLDYLLEKVGPDVAVEAMMSSTGHVFYGDLRSHERVSIPFSTFMHSCKSYLGHLNAASDSSKDKGIGEEPTCSGEMCSAGLEISEQLYLAQVSILNTENKERCSLEVLKEDIQEPIFLKGKPFSSINFWMSRAHMRSSTHYDPHHNLLCVVAGCKKVTLWSPSASPFLYPMPVYGEASNHSGVSIEEPDYSSYTRAKYMKEYSERVVLNCGDALFIPEGWYHQVDSDDLTIAINFWWKSRIMTEMLEHMDAYYLRRILRRLVDTEMNKIVQKNFFRHAKENNGFQPTDKELRGSEQFNLHNEVKSHDTSDKKGARDTSDKKGAADTSGKKVLKRLTKMT